MAGKWCRVVRGRQPSPSHLPFGPKFGNGNDEQARLVKTVNIQLRGAPWAGQDRRFQHP